VSINEGNSVTKCHSNSQYLVDSKPINFLLMVGKAALSSTTMSSSPTSKVAAYVVLGPNYPEEGRDSWATEKSNSIGLKSKLETRLIEEIPKEARKTGTILKEAIDSIPTAGNNAIDELYILLFHGDGKFHGTMVPVRFHGINFTYYEMECNRPYRANGDSTDCQCPILEKHIWTKYFSPRYISSRHNQTQPPTANNDKRGMSRSSSMFAPGGSAVYVGVKCEDSAAQEVGRLEVLIEVEISAALSLSGGVLVLLLGAGHDTGLLVVTDTLLEEIGLASEGDVLHEIERVGDPVVLLVS
jgi:hypothetical protein